jgi:CRP/FNR family cyclic AMP-dependent transcriptional regulator
VLMVPVDLVNQCFPKYPSRLFRPGDQWKQFDNMGERIFLPANCNFIEPGDKISFLYKVISGCVISLEYTEDGSEHIFNIFEEGSIFLESNLMLGFPSAVYFQTRKPCELARIDRNSLEAAIKRDFAFSVALLESMSYKYFSAMDQIRENADRDAFWRVFNLLRLLAANGGQQRDKWIKIDMKISQQMIANLLCMNRTTVCSILRDLKEQGRIETVNGYYHVRAEEVMNR